MKKITKKILSIVAVLGLVTGMIAGCTNKAEERKVVNVAGLKGPTTMGILFLEEKNSLGNANEDYQFGMFTGADEILPLMIKGEMDIALVPANVASVLYNKTNGGIKVIDINTLGVLYMVSGDDTIKEVADLAGRTIYLTGKGTTPDYVLQYLLSLSNIADCTLEYKSEATEVAAVLASEPSAVGLLPQPFVTAAMLQNDALKVVIDTTKEWQKSGNKLVTGVTVVRTAYLEENEVAVKAFMNEHKESVEAINNDVEKGAALAVEAGIVAKEPIAKKAIPACNITYIDGEDMKQAISGYLKVLYDMNPQSVGGQLPEDDFYYIGK